MENFVIKGKNRLVGDIQISGAKNAAVALVPCALLVDGDCIIDNLPNIKDVENMVEALKLMNVDVEYMDTNKIRLNASNVDKNVTPVEQLKKIRASYYLLGAMLAKHGKAEVPLPGGCDFGGRPYDLHIKGFEALGATVVTEGGLIKVTGDKLVGAPIFLDVVSVGATINIMLAAVFAEGTTTIENSAREPHIVDTANFLNKMGCKIKGAGTSVIKITGVPKDSLRGTDYTTIPDQIEAGTYMVLAAATNGDIKVNNVIPIHLDSISAKLMEMGCHVENGDNYVRVIGTEDLKTTNFTTQAYPGFPTDMQPQMLTLQTIAKGHSRVRETVWESRFQYVKELTAMGAKVTINGKVADIDGVDELRGTDVYANDLRAGAAMLIAGLSFKTEGITRIKNAKLINRGYEKIIPKLLSLGADISSFNVIDND